MVRGVQRSGGSQCAGGGRKSGVIGVKMVGMARHGGIGVVMDAGIGLSVVVMVVDVGYVGLIGVAERLIDTKPHANPQRSESAR